MHESQVSIRLNEDTLSATGSCNFYYDLETEFPLSDEDMVAIIRVVSAMHKDKMRTYAHSGNRSRLEYHFPTEGSEY